MPVGEDGILVDAGRTAGTVDHIPGQQHMEGRIVIVMRIGQDAGNLPFLGKETDHQMLVEELDTAAPGACFQLLRHGLRGQRTDGGAPQRGIVIGLVADERAVAVGREGDAGLDEVHEGSYRVGCFGEGDVAVGRFAIKESLCHLLHTVLVVAGERELVVGLLVAACVAGGAGEAVLGDNHDLFTEIVETVGCVISCGPGTDNDVRHRAYVIVWCSHKFLPQSCWMVMPPSSLITWPVVYCSLPSARTQTAWPMSSGVPQRGIRAMPCSKS